MIINRRMSLGLAGAGTLASLMGLSGAAQAQTEVSGDLAEAAAAARLPLEHLDGCFTGPGWRLLADRCRAASTVLIGEDHGVAEIARLSSQVVDILAERTLGQVGIEISPSLAREADHILRRDGLAGLRAWFERSPGVAFYTLEEEADFIAHARERMSDASAIFGFDYEVGGTAFLVDRLTKEAPAYARVPVQALAEQSASREAEYQTSRDPRRLFSFSGDPTLVRAVRSAWPNPTAEIVEVLDTLEETLTINQLRVQGDAWEATLRRVALQRRLYARQRTSSPGVSLLKGGATHMMRGLSTSGAHELGSLVAEADALNGGESLHILAVPISGRQAAFNPRTWGYDAVEVEPVLPALAGPPQDASVVLDLAALRPVALNTALNSHVGRFVFGFDIAVFINRATASRGLPMLGTLPLKPS